MNQAIKPQQIHYLSNRLGERIPEKTAKKYIDWVSIDGEERSYLAEITARTGRRIGALFLAEFPHADSSDPDDKKWAEENNAGDSKKVLEQLKKLVTQLKEKGFMAAAFEKTGPFERHELVGFVPYPQRNPDKNDWLGVAGEHL